MGGSGGALTSDGPGASHLRRARGVLLRLPRSLLARGFPSSPPLLFGRRERREEETRRVEIFGAPYETEPRGVVAGLGDAAAPAPAPRSA